MGADTIVSTWTAAVAPHDATQVAPPARSRVALRSRGLHALRRTHSGGHAPRLTPRSRIEMPAIACGVTTRQREAVLQRRENAHGAALTAARVISDTPGSWEVLTAALDKTMVHWKYKEGEISSSQLEQSRIELFHGPVFSIAQGTELSRENSATVYCGTADRSVVTWNHVGPSPVEELQWDKHCGWVKALAAEGRWLFSAACNTLQQWDLLWPSPRHVNTVELFSGDILDIVLGCGMVFTCGADGSIHSWKIDKKGGLQQTNSRPSAHEGRVSGMALYKGTLFSVGFDGHLKSWDASTLGPLVDVNVAHGGERIHCVAVGPDGILYTGGDDKMVQKWMPVSMRPLPPLYGHSGAVRVLSAGSRQALVSGDSEGTVLLWSV